MDWSSERWVKLYKKSTPSWVMLPWQSRALFPLMLKECDARGMIAVGRGGVKALAAVVRLPVQVVRVGLAGLELSGSVLVDTATISLTHFTDAQLTRSSNAVKLERHKDAKSLRVVETSGNPRKPIEESRGEESRVDQLLLSSVPADARPRSVPSGRSGTASQSPLGCQPGRRTPRSVRSPPRCA